MTEEEEKHNLNQDFLKAFPLAKLYDMTLDQYSNLNKDSFCYWIEFKTRILGSIKGGNSFKFGIYRCNKKPKKTEGIIYDGNYAWNANLGKTPQEAFKIVKEAIVEIAKLGKKGNLTTIQDYNSSEIIWDVVKWKIAFLYSNDNIIPYYSLDRLKIIANKKGMSNTKNATMGEIQKFLIGQKGELPIHEYGKKLDEIYKEYEKGSSSNNTSGDKAAQSAVKETTPKLTPSSPHYWIYAPGENASKWTECQNNGMMYLGWDQMGDYSQYASMDEIQKKLQEVYNKPESSFMNDRLALWEFCHVLKPGDVIYAKQGKTKIIGRGVVTGDYFYDKTRTTFNNCRKVNWTHTGKWAAPQESALKTLTDVTNYPDYVKQLEALFSKNTPTIQMEEIKLLELKKQIILQGAPGTGKTYKTASIAVGMCNPSFTDFSDHQKVMEEYERLQNEGRIAFCTFHQSMDYEDFIEGLKPEVKGSAVEYNVESGIFKTICEKAKKDDSLSNKPYVLIIDEINRGNISKIFGELITLLEADKRSNGTHPISLKLPYSKEDFSVPSNLYIIGTMNTTDRSTGTIDYAVRRRFAFVTLEAKEEVIKNWCIAQSVPADVMNAALDLFRQISKFIAKHKASDFELEDLKVGHSYFMAENQNALRLKMRYEVVPLLKEYIKDGILRGEPEDEKYFECWKKAECYEPSTTVVI